jgi:hypothetical protein
MASTIFSKLTAWSDPQGSKKAKYIGKIECVGRKWVRINVVVICYKKSSREKRNLKNKGRGLDGRREVDCN